jgi:hypothetical protein
LLVGRTVFLKSPAVGVVVDARPGAERIDVASEAVAFIVVARLVEYGGRHRRRETPAVSGKIRRSGW